MLHKWQESTWLPRRARHVSLNQTSKMSLLISIMITGPRSPQPKTTEVKIWCIRQSRETNQLTHRKNLNRKRDSSWVMLTWSQSKEWTWVSLMTMSSQWISRAFSRRIGNTRAPSWTRSGVRQTWPRSMITILRTKTSSLKRSCFARTAQGYKPCKTSRSSSNASQTSSVKPVLIFHRTPLKLLCSIGAKAVKYQQLEKRK